MFSAVKREAIRTHIKQTQFRTMNQMPKNRLLRTKHTEQSVLKKGNCDPMVQMLETVDAMLYVRKINKTNILNASHVLGVFSKNV